MTTSKMYSKDIICPECGEICRIKINNHAIKLYECLNDHIKDNMSNFIKLRNTQLNVLFAIK